MKVAELVEGRKKRKKKPFMWMGIPFAIVQSGTGDDTIGSGAGITGGLSEAVEDDFLLPQGHVMQYFTTTPSGERMYHISRLMDDTVLAQAGIKNTDSDLTGMWYFFSYAPPKPVKQEIVGKSNQHDLLKFKWWVTNQLVKHGFLTADDVKKAIE